MGRARFTLTFAVALMTSSVLLADNAWATDGFASGRDLKGWCDNMDMDDVHWGLCVGSITASHDMVMTYQAAGVANNLVCTTLEHTRGDVVYGVIDYLNRHPFDLDHSLGDVVLSALIEQFPCDL